MVLLIDDDPTTNFLHRRAIRQVAEDTTIHEATNGRHALELIQADIASAAPPPDYIFLDINMPELDGWGFLERYRELPAAWRRKTRVFMLTTSLNPDDHRRARGYADVIDVVDKILTRDKFSRILDSYGPLSLA